MVIKPLLQKTPLAYTLLPIAWLYEGLVGLRRWLYRRGFLTVHRVPVPVVVVGNVVAGGAGKTPTVMALVRHFQAQNKKVGIVSRGYGRKTKDCREVQPDASPTDVGDEPLLIRQSTHAPVFVAPTRLAACATLILAYPDTDLIICDDGLQHYSLHRDVEICVFDNRGIGNGWLLPAGMLREPWHSNRALNPRFLILHTGNQPALEQGFTAQRRLADYAIAQDGSRVLLTDLAQSQQPLAALAGIAQPEAFFAMLRERGVPIVETIALPDHYDFDSYTCKLDKHYRLICTEKDAPKLWRIAPDALAVPLEFTPESAFFAALDSALHSFLKPY